MSARAVILFAHGSRDPAWRRPIEAVAERMRVLRPGSRVACAYLELDTPDLASAAGELALNGARHLTILPMFLGIGRHARDDLPRLVQALRQARPELVVELRNAIGEDERVLELLAQIASE